MRLTDDPRPLSVTKPDTSWPAEVQAVMAKALQRKREDRYDSASKFGIALYQAVEHMPKVAAAGATQMMGAMDGATSVMAPPPQTRLDASPAAAPAPTTVAPVRSRVPVYGGAGVAALALAAAASIYFSKATGKSGATPQAGAPAVARSETLVTAPPVVTQQNVRAPAAGGQAGGTKAVDRPSTPVIKGTVAATPAAAPGKVDIGARLPALVAESSDSANANRVLKEAEGLAPYAESSLEKAGLGLARANAHAMLGHDKQSCDIIDTIKEQGALTPWARVIAIMVKNCAQ